MQRPTAVLLFILWPLIALGFVLCESISCSADEPPPFFQGIQTAAISSDGRLFTFGDTDITLTDTQTGRTLHTFKGCGCLVGQILFSPDNSKVVSWADVCINNGDMWEAKVWDVATGKLLRTMKAPYIGSTQSGRSGIAFLPSGLLAGTTDCDLYVRCWDIGTGKLVRLATTSTLFLTTDGGGVPETDALAHIAKSFPSTAPMVYDTLSADGERLLTINRPTDGSSATAILWDSATGKQLRIYKDEGPQYSAALAKNKLLLVGQDFGTIFNLADGSTLQLLPDPVKYSSPMWQDWYGKVHVVWAHLAKDGTEADIVTVQQVPFNHPPFWYHEKWTFFSYNASTGEIIAEMPL
jgi:WD40 repeat protein